MAIFDRPPPFLVAAIIFLFTAAILFLPWSYLTNKAILGDRGRFFFALPQPFSGDTGISIDWRRLLFFFTIVSYFVVLSKNKYG